MIIIELQANKEKLKIYNKKSEKCIFIDRNWISEFRRSRRNWMIAAEKCESITFSNHIFTIINYNLIEASVDLENLALLPSNL